MTDKKIVRLVGPLQRATAKQYIDEAPADYVVRISPPTRNLDQSAKFHAMCGDASKQVQFAGKFRPLEAWKVLFISGHAIATKEGAEILPGLEGEFCNIRESSAAMSKKRMASLIEYVIAWGVNNGVKWSD